MRDNSAPAFCFSFERKLLQRAVKLPHGDLCLLSKFSAELSIFIPELKMIWNSISYNSQQ